MVLKKKSGGFFLVPPPQNRRGHFLLLGKVARSSVEEGIRQDVLVGHSMLPQVVQWQVSGAFCSPKVLQIDPKLGKI